MSFLFQLLDRLIDRLPFSPRFFRFCVVGASGVVLNFAVLAGTWFLLPEAWGDARHRSAMALAIGVSIFTNFLLNDTWTWGDRGQTDRLAWARRLARFYLVSLVAAALQWGVSVALYEGLELARHIGPVGLYGAQGTGIIVAMGLNFAANHMWTFRGRNTPR